MINTERTKPLLMETRPLTPREASEYLGISLSALYYLNHRKRLIYYRAKNGRKIFYKLEDLQKFAFGNPVADDSF